MTFSIRSPRSAAFSATIVGAACLAAPALAQPAGDSAPYDPFEPVNRRLYAVHRGLDKVIIRPVTLGYVAVLPRPVRSGLRNVVYNLGEPVTVVNDLLQLRVGKAASATGRFLTNSTVGLLGLFDVATKQGVERHVADFGQTLGRYGVPAGPYIFIPGLGPSTVRDLGGRVVDNSADPVRMVRFDGRSELQYGRIAVTALDARAEFDDELQEFDRTAIDPYVSLRSAYLQNRQASARGGKVDVEALPSFDPEPGPADAAPAPSRTP